MIALNEFVRLGAASIIISLLLTVSPLQARDYHYADAHLHYVDFFQESEGIDRLIAAMNDGNIDHVMISGIAVAKKWHEDEPQRPRYYAGDDAAVYWYSATDFIVIDALARLSKKERKRFHPFLTGFNPVDKNADRHIRRLLEMYPGFWQGIGEIFTRHDDLTALMTGDVPRANNEALQRVYRLAAEYDLPVLLHSNITSQRERKPLYLEELEQAVATHPNVRFIWAHAGTSAEIHRHQQKLDFLSATLKRLLDSYDNLYIDLSWSVLETYLLDQHKRPDPGWVALIEAYPERFMLGSDVVGRFGNLSQHMHAFDPFLDALSRETADKVARGNFLSVLPKSAHTATTR